MLGLFSALLLAARATASPAQVVLSPEHATEERVDTQSTGGVLRRFSVSHGQAEGLLAHAQVRARD